MISKCFGTAALGLAFLMAACSSSDPNPTTPPVGGGGNNPPATTNARITIQTTTSTPTIWAGSVFGRSGTTSATRAQFLNSDNRCAAAPARTCTFDVKIGDTVSLAATDNQAEINIAQYSTVAQVDDSRSIKSQFQSWSAPCTTRERGTCVFRATGDVTVNAQFKSLTQTKFFFSGYGNWQLTVTAPTTIGLLATTPDATQTSVAAFGGAGSYAHCLGEAPGIRCLEVHTADNSTLSFDVFPIQGVPPVGTIGPLTFVGFSGGCSAATTPSPFATATCKMSSGTDQTATVKWQYYRCVSNSGASYANAGFAGHKLPPNEPTLTLNNCVLTQ